MKRLIAMTLIVSSFIACKKDKELPVPETVIYESFGLQYDEDLGIKTKSWFNLTDLKPIAMPQVSLDPGIQKNILFGYFQNGTNYGIYSPEVYPLEYGQENWLHHQSVVFKKSTLSYKEYSEIANKNNGNLPASEIINAWKTGINPKTSITHPHEGEIFLFRTTDNKVTGLIVFTTLSDQLTTIMGDIWIAK